MAFPARARTTEELFRVLDVPMVLRFVLDRRAEDLTLDFKLARRAFDHRDERKVLAIATSGFANSSGGLVVWGVDARLIDDVDCAQSVVPLDNVEAFFSRLVDYSGTACSPSVSGVEHRVLEGDGGPFAVTYVPESSTGPHMAKLGEDRYYKRSGSRFLVMEHFEIADMFGRRPTPVLSVLFQPDNDGTIRVSIRNDGRGSARATYLELTIPRPFQHSVYGADGNGRFGLPILAHDSSRPTFGSQADALIHPRQTLVVTRIDATTKSITGRPIVEGTLRFGYAIAADGLPLTPGETSITFSSD